MLHTPLTKLLGIRTPLVSAAMTGTTTPALAAQVCLAGGFGFVAPTPSSVETFAHELDEVRTALGTPRDAPLAVGAGFLGWVLDKGGPYARTLDAALAQRVTAVWLSFGADLGAWVRHVRAYDRARAQPHTTLVWVVVSSAAEAVRAAGEWRADVLVVQGCEAGGHGHSAALPLFTLLPSVARALPDAPPLVAAGGLTDGAHVAAVLMLGAAGAVFGTRFVATPESKGLPAHKAQIIASADTVRSFAFDEAGGTTGWPAGVDGRGLRNEIEADAQAGRSLEERRRLFQESAAKKDASRAVVWAGASVGLITEMHDAAAVVHAVHSELLAHLRRAGAILTGR